VSVTTLSAEIRTELGKGAARRTRRAGQIPAVLYGHGEAPKHLALPAKEFATAIRYGGMTNVLALELSDGSRATALPKAVQRDPIKNVYKHADLLLVRRGEKVTVEVPVELTGEAAKGTLVINELNHVAISADATRLPDRLEASIDGLDAGERVTAADVRLPSGSDLISDPEAVLAIVSVAPSAEQMEAEGGEPVAEAPEAVPAEPSAAAEAPAES
jgi:large subunit ribosomal protein L25